MNPALALRSRGRKRNALRAGFTLVEILIVAGVIALICTLAIPSIYQLAKKTGLRRAISDLRDVCANARAQAIFTGSEVTVVFYPLERRFGISGSSTPASGKSGAFEEAPGTSLPPCDPRHLGSLCLDCKPCSLLSAR